MASNNRKWRASHPEEWQAQKRKRRERNLAEIGATQRRWRHWTPAEIGEITAEARPIDGILSLHTGRSIASIQMMRSLVLHNKVAWNNGKLVRVSPDKAASSASAKRDKFKPVPSGVTGVFLFCGVKW